MIKYSSLSLSLSSSSSMSTIRTVLSRCASRRLTTPLQRNHSLFQRQLCILPKTSLWTTQQHQNQSQLQLGRFHSTSTIGHHTLVDDDDDVDYEHHHDPLTVNVESTTLPETPPTLAAVDTGIPLHQRVWYAAATDHNNDSMTTTTRTTSPSYWTETFLETTVLPLHESLQEGLLSSSSSSSSSSSPTATSSLHDHDPVEFWAFDDDNVDNDVDHMITTAAATATCIADTTAKTSSSYAGRLRARQLGVLDEDPVKDVQLLTENYTVPSLALALRDREDVLQQCAELALQEDWKGIASILEPFQHQYVLERRQQHTHHGQKRGTNQGILVLKHHHTEQEASSSTTAPTTTTTNNSHCNLVKPLDTNALELIRKALMRMPRQVIQAHTQRAGVVLPLCHVHSVPSLLLERRAAHLSSHPNEVCLPGGMICKIHDRTIVATCLREMREEIPALESLDISVLGVLRCNWGDLHHLVGKAVTPVVCWLGEIEQLAIQPNPSEVSQVFSIPLASLLDPTLWRHRDGYAPVFLGGPYEIWGLTGYILERFAQDILRPHSSTVITTTLMKK